MPSMEDIDVGLGAMLGVLQVLLSFKAFGRFFRMMKDMTALEWRYFFYAFFHGFAVSLCYATLYSIYYKYMSDAPVIYSVPVPTPKKRLF